MHHAALGREVGYERTGKHEGKGKVDGHGAGAAHTAAHEPRNAHGSQRSPCRAKPPRAINAVGHILRAMPFL